MIKRNTIPRAKHLKTFEYTYLFLEPFLPTLYQMVRRRLLGITRGSDKRLRILDVGGRKSHYTIGLPADVTITDVPRESQIQHQLHLGINAGIISELYARRSNVTSVQFDDMTRSAFASEQFDCVVAVEVLEHIDEDAQFISEVHRVLKPGAVFLMTTPNGQYVKNTNPDHKRHYSREALGALLSSSFDSVNIDYAVRSGLFYNLALRSWSFKRPFVTAMAMLGAVVNSIQSAAKTVRDQPIGAQELFAVARKH